MKINAHDIDNELLAKAFETKDYEVWLHEPFVAKGKQSDWPNKIARNEIKEKIHLFDDAVITGLPQIFWDYLAVRYSDEIKSEKGRAADFKNVVEVLSSFTGKIFITLFDPRDQFLLSLTCQNPKSIKCDKAIVDKLESILKRTIIISPSDIKNIIEVSGVDDNIKKQLLSRKNAISTHVFHMHSLYSTAPLRNSYQYETVYVGMGAQNKDRKKMIKDMISKHENVYTAGPLILGKNIPNLTLMARGPKSRLIISKNEVLRLTRDSRVNILTAEPGHIHWPTPRMYECLAGGTIPAIHPSFPSASLIPRTFERCAVNHIRDISTDKIWEAETYAIANEEILALQKMYPLDIIGL